MTKRERFLSVINGLVPDRVPVLATLTPQVAVKLAERLGIDEDVQPVDSFLSTRVSHVAIVNALGNDAVIIGAGRQKGGETVKLEDGRARDEFGFISKPCGLYDEIVERPLANCETPEDVMAYKFPDPNDPHRYELARKNYEKYHKDYAIVGDLEATIFETAWNLVGLEKFLMDIMCEEEYIDVLLDKVTEYSKAIALNLVDIGCDMIWLGDDIGMQNAPMFNLDIHTRYFKPRMKEITDAIKRRNPNVKIAYHSCGAIRSFIPNIIEMGIDILNPIQPLADGMNLAELKKAYGKNLIFFGCIDVQDVMPNGSKEDIQAEVKLRIEQGGKNGGLILAPAHNIQPDTPVENVLAMYEAIDKYGKY